MYGRHDYKPHDNWAKVKELVGVQIYLDPIEGTFHAKVGDWLQRKDLKALEREITSRASGSVTLLRDGRHSKVPDIVEVVRLEGSRYRTKAGALTEGTYGFWVYDEALLERFRDLDRRSRESAAKFEAEYQELRKEMRAMPQNLVVEELQRQNATPKEAAAEVREGLK